MSIAIRGSREPTPMRWGIGISGWRRGGGEYWRKEGEQQYIPFIFVRLHAANHVGGMGGGLVGSDGVVVVVEEEGLYIYMVSIIHNITYNTLPRSNPTLAPPNINYI